MRLPATIAFVITSKCNLRCKMCFQYGESAQKKRIKGNALLGNPKELTFAQLQTIIKKINKYYPLDQRPNFFITGGEPFARKDMANIIQYSAQQGNKVTVNTNLSMIDRKTIRKLAEIENFIPLVSLDGPETIHDKIREVKGTYKKVMENIKFFSIQGKSIDICTTITKYNVDHLFELYKSLKGLKVFLYLKHVAWMPYQYVELQKKLSKKYFNVDLDVYLPETVSVPTDKIKALKHQMAKIRKKKNKYKVMFQEIARPKGTSLFEHHCTFNCKQKNKVCYSPEVNILPDGNISFCNGAAYGLGPIYANALKDELPEILRKKRSLEKIFNKLLKKGELFPVCVKCSYLQNAEKLGFFKRVKAKLKRVIEFSPFNNSFQPFRIW